MTLNRCHLLLTRFNIRYTTFADPRVLSCEWLGARMELFRQFTLPSVASQSQLPDAWLVFFDECTPSASRGEFQRLTGEFPLLHVEYCRVFTPELVVERVRRIMAPSAEWLLTTRLDNDDALHRRFIETVQSHARDGISEFINPTNGLILANGQLYRHRDFSSPFITLSEPAAACRTVLIDQHPLLARHAPVRQFALPDAWVQVVHGGNLANAVRGVLVSPAMVSPDALPSTLSVSLVRVGRAKRTFYNYFTRLLLCARRAWRSSWRAWPALRAGDSASVQRPHLGSQH